VANRYALIWPKFSLNRPGYPQAHPFVTTSFPQESDRTGPPTYIAREMANIRHIHQYMTDRQKVLLQDGRAGKIVRIDTDFPRGKTTVSVWTGEGPGIAKVDIGSVVGPAPHAKKTA